MENEFIVDVIIPAFNAEAFISDAINSVLMQTLVPKEIIVVDDGSSDGTADLLSSFGDKITVVKHHKNKGLPAARNTGIKAGKSPLLAFLDADDVWLPYKLERQLVAFAEDASIGLCYSSLQDCDENLSPISHSRSFKERRSEIVFDELFKKPFPMPPSTVIVRRDAMEQCGFFDESMLKIEDYECWLRIAMLYPISCIPDSLCLRRLHESAISSTYGYGEKIKWEFEVIERCFEASNKFNIAIPFSKKEARIDALRRRLFKHTSWNDKKGALLYKKMLTEEGRYTISDEMKVLLLSYKASILNILSKMKRKLLKQF